MEENKKPITFSEPNAFKQNKSNGLYEVDLAGSEFFVLLEALGTPKIYYAQKQNKYFKDEKCTKTFSDAELLALELPIPAEIDSARKKAIKAANDKGELLDMTALLLATSPKEVLPPKHIRDRLITVDPVERMINRINRSTVGK